MSNQAKAVLLILGFLTTGSVFSAASDECLFVKHKRSPHHTEQWTIPLASQEPFTGKSFGELFHESSSKGLPFVLGLITCSTKYSSSPQYRFIDVCSFLRKHKEHYSSEDFINYNATLATISKYLPSLAASFNIPNLDSIKFGDVFFRPDRQQLGNFTMKDPASLAKTQDLLSLYLTFALAGQKSALKEIALEFSRFLLTKLQLLDTTYKSGAPDCEKIAHRIVKPHVVENTLYWLNLAKSQSNDHEVTQLLEIFNEYLKLTPKQ